ncbi:hypothetical protein JCM6882_004432 [Rhodosporidiobolus microsporus]
MPVALPPELLVLILELLDGDKDALGACCLVSQAFRDHAQPVLWSFVELGSVEEGAAVAQAISGNVRLAGFVKGLRIEEEQLGRYWPLAGILDALPDVEVVRIEEVRPFEEEAFIALNGLKGAFPR